MRMPRRLLALISASAQSTNSATLASRAASAATARRYEMRLAGCTRPVAARSASLSMTRGAKLEKPAPRSGSMTMMRAIFRLASPSSSGSPTARPSASSSAASTHAVPLAGAAATSTSLRARRLANAQPAAQRIGVADGLDADQPRRAALLVGRAAHARKVRRRRGGEAELARPRREQRRRRLVAGDDRVAAEQLARVAGEAAVDAVGEEADRRQRGDRERHGDDQEAQLAGAKVAQQLAPAELPRRRRARAAAWRRARRGASAKASSSARNLPEL